MIATEELDCENQCFLILWPGLAWKLRLYFWS